MATTFSTEQITNGRLVLATVHANVAKALWPIADLITMMVAFDESSLHIYTNADEPAAEGSSRGIFQQLSAWGSYAARTDPVQSTQMFLHGGAQGQHGLLSIPGWMGMAPQLAAEAVQQSATPGGGNYLAQMGRARDFITQYGSGNLPPVTPGTGANNGVATGHTGNATTAGVATGVNAGFGILNTPTPGGLSPPDSPPWWSPFQTPFQASAATGTNAAVNTVTSLTQWANSLTTMLTWLISPSNWLRIVAGVGGLGILTIAIVFIATAN